MCFAVLPRRHLGRARSNPIPHGPPRQRATARTKGSRTGSSKFAQGVRKVEAIGRNSNLADMSNKWSDLRKRIDELPPRSPLSTQEGPKPRSKRFLTSQDIAGIMHRYKAGETTQQVGTRYGISKTRVGTILRDQGITIRRQGSGLPT